RPGGQVGLGLARVHHHDHRGLLARVGSITYHTTPRQGINSRCSLRRLTVHTRHSPPRPGPRHRAHHQPAPTPGPQPHSPLVVTMTVPTNPPPPPRSSSRPKTPRSLSRVPSNRQRRTHRAARQTPKPPPTPQPPRTALGPPARHRRRLRIPTHPGPGMAPAAHRNPDPRRDRPTTPSHQPHAPAFH